MYQGQTIFTCVQMANHGQGNPFVVNSGNNGGIMYVPVFFIGNNGLNQGVPAAQLSSFGSGSSFPMGNQPMGNMPFSFSHSWNTVKEKISSIRDIAQNSLVTSSEEPKQSIANNENKAVFIRPESHKRKISEHNNSSITRTRNASSKRRPSGLSTDSSASAIVSDVDNQRRAPARTEKRTASGKLNKRRRVCEIADCFKLSQGRTTLCYAHGGGYRCQEQGCSAAARGKAPFCIKHGGGFKCAHPGCTSSARGKERLCISHGGGKRSSGEGFKTRSKDDEHTEGEC